MSGLSLAGLPGAVSGLLEGEREGPSWATASAPGHPIPSLCPQPTPLILDPGPIYAVDGDAAINQRITYSIIGGE